jgi:hypothetical protein
MRRALVVVMALLIVVASASAGPPADAGVRASHRNHLTEWHNNKRAKFGHGPFTKSKWSNALAQSAARRIAAESGGGCNLRHTDPNALLGWYNAAAAENIACVWGCIDSRTAFRQFWRSGPHRANMLGGYRWIGIGIECWGPMSYFAIHYVA